MKRPFWRFLRSAVVVVVAFSGVFFSGHDACSQPARAIKVIIAAPPDGPTDILAQLFAEQMAQALGRVHGPIIATENRTVADGIVGTEAASRAAPDGNTLLITVNSFLINPYLKHVNYDPLVSFEPVCYLVNSPEVVVVNNTSHYRTLGDLLGAARGKPGAVTMASFGPAGALHIAVEMLKRAANVDMTYIPYASELPVVSALLTGGVTSAFASYIGVADYLKAAKLRALAVGSRNRIDPLPDIPTVAASGYNDFETEARLWLLAPAMTPKEAVSQIAGWFTAAMQLPDVKAKLVAQGLYPVGMCGAEFVAYIRKKYDEYGRIMRDSKIYIQ